MRYLLDTDTCIYWLKGQPSVRTKLLEAGWQEIAICAISVAELYYGAYNSSRISENLDRTTRFIQQVPVLQFTDLALQRFVPILPLSPDKCNAAIARSSKL